MTDGASRPLAQDLIHRTSKLVGVFSGEAGRTALAQDLIHRTSKLAGVFQAEPLETEQY